MESIGKCALALGAALFLAPFVAAAQDGTPVTRGSNARYNLQETRDFLLIASVNEPAAKTIADELQNQLNSNNLYWHPLKDFLGYNAEGRTFRNGRQSFREDRIRPDRAFKFLGTDEGFRVSMRLLIVVVHEAMHLIDYRRIPIGPSGENQAYQRGYAVMLDILKNFMITHGERLEFINDPEADQWKTWIRLYALALLQEMKSYLVHEYGELGEFVPLRHHGGCVRNLSRSETVLYLSGLEKALASPGKLSDQLARFDAQMRYRFPPAEPNAQCVVQVPVTPVQDASYPVGYASLWQYHQMFEVNVPANHSLVLTRLSRNDNVSMDILVEAPEAGGVKTLRRCSHMASYHTGTLCFAKAGGKHLVVVAQDAPKEEPLDYKFVARGRYLNEAQQTVEYDLQPRQLSVAENAAYGFHPRFNSVVPFAFSERSAGAPRQMRRTDAAARLEAVEFEVQKGDELRFRVPQFEERYVILYRVKARTGNDPHPSLEPAAPAMLAEHSGWRNLPPADGDRYLLVIFRSDDVLSNTRAAVEFQLARAGKVPPSQFAPRWLSAADGALYGFHPPSTGTISVAFRPNSPDRACGPFLSQAIVSLGARKGDEIEYTDIEERGPRRVDVKKLEEKKLADVFPMIERSLRSGRFVVNDDAEYVLLLCDSELLGPVSSTDIAVRRWRYSLGPPPDKLRQWGPEEQATRLGYFPYVSQNQPVDLTAASAKGFIFKDHPFQMMEFRVSGERAFAEVRSPLPQVLRRVFLYRVDEKKFAAHQASLVEIRRLTPWFDALHMVGLDRGRYLLVIESDRKEVDAQVPLRINFSQENENPANWGWRVMRPAEHADHRYRPVP